MSGRAPFIAGRTTGPQLYAALAARAAELGLELNEFVRPLNTNPNQMLRLLLRSQTPTSLMITRVAALIDGTPIPPPQTKARILYRQDTAQHPIGPVPPPVERDPCFLCGTRADIGCRHTRHSQ